MFHASQAIEYQNAI